MPPTGHTCSGHERCEQQPKSYRIQTGQWSRYSCAAASTGAPDSSVAIRAKLRSLWAGDTGEDRGSCEFVAWKAVSRSSVIAAASITICLPPTEAGYPAVQSSWGGPVLGCSAARGLRSRPSTGTRGAGTREGRAPRSHPLLRRGSSAETQNSGTIWALPQFSDSVMIGDQRMRRMHCLTITPCTESP